MLDSGYEEEAVTAFSLARRMLKEKSFNFFGLSSSHAAGGGDQNSAVITSASLFVPA